MGAKMKTLEEQHQDYQRHIAVLKESLCAKEEHYNMLQADVEELRQRLEEKNRHIEKKTQQQQQERARAAAEIAELREHMDIKDRKINVLQRKVFNYNRFLFTLVFCRYSHLLYLHLIYYNILYRVLFFRRNSCFCNR